MYTIVANTKLPVYVPLTGWRALLARFRIPVRRRVMVLLVPEKILLCAPASVEKLERHLRKLRVSYRVAITKPKLRVVETEDKK